MKKCPTCGGSLTPGEPNPCMLIDEGLKFSPGWADEAKPPYTIPKGKYTISGSMYGESFTRDATPEECEAFDKAASNVRRNEMIEELKYSTEYIHKLRLDYNEVLNELEAAQREIAELKKYGEKPCPICGDFFESNDSLQAKLEISQTEIAQLKRALARAKQMIADIYETYGLDGAEEEIAELEKMENGE